MHSWSCSYDLSSHDNFREYVTFQKDERCHRFHQKSMWGQCKHELNFDWDLLIQKYSSRWFNSCHHQATGQSLISDPPHPHDVDIYEDVDFPEIEMITTDSLLLQEKAPTNSLGEDKYDDDEIFLPGMTVLLREGVLHIHIFSRTLKFYFKLFQRILFDSAKFMTPCTHLSRVRKTI